MTSRSNETSVEVSTDASDVAAPGSRTLWLLLALVVSTVAGTWLIISFGPAPRDINPSSDLWPDFPGTVLSEPSDRLLLVFWLGMGVISVAGSLVLATLGRTQGVQRGQALAIWALLTVLLAVLIMTMMRSTEPHDDWRGLAPVAVLLAGLVTVILAIVRHRLPKLWPLANGVLAVVALGYLLAAGWQTHASIRDPFHFGITLDDFMRGSTLAVPYADYLPTYTAFLGHPLAIFQGLPGQSQVAIATYWIIALQLAAVLTAFLLVRSATVPGNRGIALLLLIAPVAFAQVGTGQSALQSAPVVPSRVVLPLVAFVLLLLALRNVTAGGNRSPWLLIGSGVALSAAALNNVEFGLTALAAAMVTVVISGTTLKVALTRLLFLMAGVFAFGLLFLAFSSLASSPFDPLNMVRIQLIYAAAGYDLHPMIALGPFLPFVLVSLFAMATGVTLIRNKQRNQQARVRGFILLLTGSWMLLSFGYFSGRSFTSVLFAGLAIQLGILLAVFGDFAWRLLASRWPSTQQLGFGGWVGVTLIPTFFGLMLVLGGNAPQRTLAFGHAGSPAIDLQYADFDAVREVVSDASVEVENPRIYLVVGPSAVTSRIAEMEDGTVMSRVFLSVSRTLMEFQCQRLPTDGFLVVESPIADRVESLSACREHLELVNADVPVVPGLDVRTYRLKDGSHMDAASDGE